MSSHASNRPARAVRRTLTGRQPETLDRLLQAAAEELREVGHEALTVRSVAARAGVSPATAYNYLASRDHLFAELFWRHLADHPAPPPEGLDRVARVQAVTRHLALTIAAAPELAAAATRSMLGQDPDVAGPRLRTGALFAERFLAALDPGPAAAPGPGAGSRERALLSTLLTAFSGALLQAGMGMTTYTELADVLDEVVAVIMEGHR